MKRGAIEDSSMNNMKNIPSDEEFDRASKKMERLSRNLDLVREKVLQHFRRRSPLHDFYILDQRDVDFRAYVFFEKDKDIELCKCNGITQEIIDCIYAELVNAGRGNKGEIKVAFEFDSHENVTANFEGNYLLRIR